ncbi:RNA-binding protein [Halobacteriales archaeon QS_4_70_19]|nr:MAG: RNA-binding protein [Halobacteriales archaeon QS_4_70_19]
MVVATEETLPAAAGATGPASGVDPLLLGGGIVAILVAAGVLLFLRIRAVRSGGRRFRAALAAIDEVAILTHPNPDPDALASALAVRELAASVGTEATIYYPGEIRHEENRALVAELDVEATRLRDANGLVSRDVVLVDHNQPRGFAGAGGLDPYAVVDHHPGDGEGRAFTDVRPEYGACASLLAEYLRTLGWRTEAVEDATDDDPVMPESLATALVYGIRSDTAGFTRGCTDAEFDAAAYCSRRADPDTIQRVSTPPMSAETMDVRARAVLDRVRRGSFVCTHAGQVPSPDAVAQAADDLLRMEGVRAVVVAGTCAGTLHLSGRAAEGSVDIGETLATAIEGIPMADAGGHARMGGGQLSVEHMSGLGPGDGVSVERLFESLFAIMASQDPGGAPDESAAPLTPGTVAASDTTTPATPVDDPESSMASVREAIDRLEPSSDD